MVSKAASTVIPANQTPKLNYLNNGHSLKSWLLTTDHKRIALLYLVSITFFFAWLCFLFPLIEPDRRSYRIRLSEKTHVVTCDAVCNF